jgi:hypothetical protein
MIRNRCLVITSQKQILKLKGNYMINLDPQKHKWSQSICEIVFALKYFVIPNSSMILF